MADFYSACLAMQRRAHIHRSLRLSVVLMERQHRIELQVGLDWPKEWSLVQIGDAVLTLDKDTWTQRFVAQLAILQGRADPDHAASIADDCWDWDGWGSPEVAAQDYFKSVALRAG